MLSKTTASDHYPLATAETRYTRRARYFNSRNAFNIKRSPVPRHQFIAERDAALDPATGTALIPLDLSAKLGSEYPASTPLLLARYARICAGESLSTQLKATGELYYVIAGDGDTTNGDDTIAWHPGDVFCLPGGGETLHRAGDTDCVLWLITNEPQLALEHTEPPTPENAPIEAVHYPSENIDRELDQIYAMPPDEKRFGLAVIFSSEALEGLRSIHPSLTLAMNSLPPKASQRGHRHNAVALTLCIQGKDCYSMIEGERIDWQPHAVMVTPPAEIHSHHNDSDERMLSLVVQDGGLYYHCRTMGFEEPAG